MTPFVLLGTVWTAIALAWLAWLAGRLTGRLTGQPTGPGFGGQFVTDLLARQWDTAYPGLDRTVVAVVYGVLVAATAAPIVAGWIGWQRLRTHAGDPLPSLAKLRDLTDLTPAGVTLRARHLRPSITAIPDKKLRPADTGLALGTMLLPRHRRGPLLRASWEDGVLALMGPRAGKTSSLAVPQILDAPGAVLATSNRADVWATTHTLRADVGRVWVFDPQAITRCGQHWWWNPLTGIRSVEDASRMASHFVQPIRRDKGNDFWLLAAEDLLTSFFLAAAASGSAMGDVQAWLADAADDEPVALLFAHDYPEIARALRGRQNGAPETRDGIYETARTAARCLQDPRTMTWVSPPTSGNMPCLTPQTFPTTSDTLYLLSKDGAGSAGPLVAALTDQIMRYAVLCAEGRGGRLDPPMLAMLDEAANVCPLADLPQLYSHYGGRGITLVTILQTYQQGTTVWGERGMAVLWGAATIKLVGAGGDDPRFATDVSTLIGEHDVTTLALTRDATGHVSRQISTRRQRIMGTEDVRALARGTAILLASGARPAMLRLNPWFHQPNAAALTAHTATAVAQISDAAERERLTNDLTIDGIQLDIPPGPPAADGGSGPGLIPYGDPGRTAAAPDNSERDAAKADAACRGIAVCHGPADSATKVHPGSMPPPASVDHGADDHRFDRTDSAAMLPAPRFHGPARRP